MYLRDHNRRKRRGIHSVIMVGVHTDLFPPTTFFKIRIKMSNHVPINKTNVFSRENVNIAILYF